MENSIGNILKEWRKNSRYSQLQLSIELGISSKHISFIETGRSHPSKEMILKISEFLYVPKREINRALHVAGHAPLYTELTASDDSFKPVFNAINIMINNHMPYPALVLNHDWDIVKTNESAKNLMENLGFTKYSNLIEALASETPGNSKIVNWHEVVKDLLIRLQQEISILGNSNRLQLLERELRKCLMSFSKEANNMESDQIVFLTKFRLNEQVSSFFSIFAQLGNVKDVTLSEYKVELMFPADESTKRLYK